MTVRHQLPQFSIVPLWVVEEASARALKLYCILGAKYSTYEKDDFLYAGAHPSQTTLAKDLDCSVSSIQRAIEELIEIGALMIRERFNPDGGQSSNDYIVIVVKDVPSVKKWQKSGAPSLGG